MHHDHEPKSKVHGMVARFKTPEEIMKAAKSVRQEGYKKIECYTPFPVHGLDEAIGFRESKVQWIIFISGFIGACTGLALQYWVSAVEYPLNVGGRPLFSWPSFIPVTFECTILFASFGAVLGSFALNGLPQPHHPIFDADEFDKASQNRFFLCVESEDEQYDAINTKRFMETLGAEHVSEVVG